MSVYAALVLLVTVRRIEDRLIKNYTKWVGLSVLGVILGIFSTSVFLNPYFFPLVLPAYIMYRAAGSLSIRTREIASE